MLILSLPDLSCAGLECGPGTHEEDGLCLPDGDSGDTADTGAPIGPLDVCDDGVAPFSDLQLAIDAAADGDELTVCSGWWGRVSWAGKAISIRGVDGPYTTWLQGDATHPALTIRSAPGGTISGFTLTGDGAAPIAAASIDDSTVTLRDLHVTGIVGDPASDRRAVSVRGGAVAIADTEWHDNYDVGSGLHLEGGGHTLVRSSFHHNDGGTTLVEATDGALFDVRNNVLYENDHQGLGFGLSYADGASGRASHNTFVDNAFEIDAVATTGVDFDNNVSYGARGAYGFALRDADAEYNLAWSASAVGLQDEGAGPGNLEADPLLADPGNADFHLREGSPAIDAGHPDAPADADGTRADIGAYGGPDPYPL